MSVKKLLMAIILELLSLCIGMFCLNLLSFVSFVDFKLNI